MNSKPETLWGLRFLQVSAIGLFMDVRCEKE